MRHHNPSTFRHRKICKPYYHQYIDSYNRTKFENADASKRYVQILKYIADHDGCMRKNVIVGVFKLNPDYVYEKSSRARGYASIIFAQLLYLDLIDYDDEFRYHITLKGSVVLNRSYINDLAKFVKEK